VFLFLVGGGVGLWCAPCGRCWSLVRSFHSLLVFGALPAVAVGLWCARCTRCWFNLSLCSVQFVLQTFICLRWETSQLFPVKSGLPISPYAASLAIRLHQLLNFSTPKLLNSKTSQLLNFSTPKLLNSKTSK